LFVATLLLAALALPALPQPAPALAQASRGGEPFALAWNAAQKRATADIGWGDVDLDGDADLVVANQGQLGQVYLSTGRARFSPDPRASLIGRVSGGNIPFDATVLALALGDVDGDGDPDLAVASDDAPPLLYRNCTRGASPGCASTVRFALDEGFLALQREGNIQEGGNRALAWGDIDGDGDLDLAVSGSSEATVIYRNEGGTLGVDERNPAVGFVEATALAWGDMDGDGDLDLAIGANAQAARIYRNDGAGVLGLDASNPLIGALPNAGFASTVALAWADLDGDGDRDLVLASADTALQIYQNDGAGGLSLDPRDPGPSTASGLVTVRSLAVADMDGDGDLDLALGTARQGARVHRNDGTGGFPESSRIVVGAGVDTLGLAWGDADGDGNLDLALGNADSPSQVYRNLSLGLRQRLLVDPATQAATNSVSYASAMADIDGDGDLDLLVANRGAASQLFRNDGSGGMTLVAANPPLGWLASGAFADVSSAAWGDMDGDGDLDLALGAEAPTNGPDPTVLLYRNSGGALGRDGANTGVGALAAGGFGKVLGVAWGDVDGDRDLDLAVAIDGAPSQLYRNNGAGQLTLDTAAWAPAGADSTAVAWADMDVDGDLDLVLANGNSPSQLFRNCAYPDPDVACRPGELLAYDRSWKPVSADISSAAWGDVDGNGLPDLVLGSNGSPSQLFRNLAGRLTLDEGWTPEPAGTTAVALDDMDGDGDLDLAMANDGQASRIYRNEGAGRLELAPVGPTLGALGAGFIRAKGLAWGDLNGDGASDLVLASLAIGQPDMVYFSGGPGRGGAANAPPTLTIDQPLSAAGPLLASARVADTSPVRFTYRLRDREGDSVGALAAEFSLDGGGTWSIARPDAATATSGLATLPDEVAAPIGAPRAIPANGGLLSPLTIAPPANGTPGTLRDLVVYVNINHPDPGQLRLTLRGPGGIVVPLLAAPGGDRATQVRLVFSQQDGRAIGAVPPGAPLAGLFRPAGDLTAVVAGKSPVGQWQLEVADGGAGTAGPRELVSWGMRLNQTGVAHSFAWDSFGSGFFGRSDTVLLRLKAVPAPRPQAPVGPLSYRAQPGGPLGQSFGRASTAAFRAQGIQIAVRQDGRPVAGALVYHRKAGEQRARQLVSASGAPLTTNSLGLLAGRSAPRDRDNGSLGGLAVGDTIAALLPLPTARGQGPFRRFYTSPIAETTGEPLTQIRIQSGNGLQVLTVEPARPLLLFNLSVGVEWDASSDPQYREQLAADLRRVSELLYDWTDGQAALGRIDVRYGPESLAEANIRVYATNRLRPNANQGGVVAEVIRESVNGRTLTYAPGTVNMGVVWTRFGGGASFGEDWARALAHELGHYLFYLDDNYLGRDASNALVGIPQTPNGRPCRGAMSDPYRDDFSEFQPRGPEWDADCARTLSAVELQRPDWVTIKRWYDLPAASTVPFTLRQPLRYDERPGPVAQVLDLTTVAQHLPAAERPPLATPVFSLVRDDGGRYFYRPGSRVRAFRFTDDDTQIVDLGRPTLDQIDARGVRAGDRLCVYDLGGSSADARGGVSGCATVFASTSQITLSAQTWLPDIAVTPLPNQKLKLTVWVEGLAGGPAAPNLLATLFPRNAPIAMPVTITLTPTGSTYVGTFDPKASVPAGYVRVRVAGDPLSGAGREAVTEFTINGAPRDTVPQPQSHNCIQIGTRLICPPHPAPVTVSADGQMSIYGEAPAEGQYYSLQTATRLPRPPAWATPVGQPFRLITNITAAPGEPNTYINAAYLESELPGGTEGGLALYFYEATQQAWRRLPSTRFDPARNEVAAAAMGEGLYALMTRVEAQPGWNLVSYPWAERLPVLSATAQLNLSPGVNFTTIHANDPTHLSDPWKLYDVDAPYWLNDLRSLEYGRGYWFVVPPQGGTPPSLQAAETSGAPTPPAIIYGVLWSGRGPAPAWQREVTVYSGTTLCAKNSSFRVPVVEGDADGPQQIVFSVELPAAGQGALPGCGISGQPLRVFVGGTMLGSTRWDNTRPISFRQLYLPALRR